MAHDATWEADIDWPNSGPQRIYDLAQALEPGIPHHPAHPPYAFALTKLHGEVPMPEGVTAASELIAMGGHVGTHIDSLGHVARDGRIHGGCDIMAHQSYTGGLGCGAIDEVPPFMAPGRLVDAPRLFGRALTGDDVISADVFETWFEEHPAPPEGSVVLVRTGWDEHWKDNRRYLSHGEGTPGVDLAGAEWLSARGVVATGSDTIAYEKLPAPGLPVHAHLLVDQGIYIMEALRLASLAGDEAYSFFFVTTPLKIAGGTGSPIRPLAIVPA